MDADIPYKFSIKKPEIKIQNLLTKFCFNKGLCSKSHNKTNSTNKLLVKYLFIKNLFLEDDNEPIIARLPRAFKNFARSYAVKIFDNRDQKIQLHITKAYVINLLNNLSIEIRSFNFCITL